MICVLFIPPYSHQLIWHPYNIFFISRLNVSEKEKTSYPFLGFCFFLICWNKNQYNCLLLILVVCMDYLFFQGTPLPAVPGWDSAPSIYWWWSWRKFSWLFSSSLTFGNRWLHSFIHNQIFYRKCHPVCSLKKMLKILTIWQYELNVFGYLSPPPFTKYLHYSGHIYFFFPFFHQLQHSLVFFLLHNIYFTAIEILKVKVKKKQRYLWGRDWSDINVIMHVDPAYNKQILCWVLYLLIY